MIEACTQIDLSHIANNQAMNAWPHYIHIYILGTLSKATYIASASTSNR